MKTIDLNADLGEKTGNDSLIMPLISSCNIACGGHAGDRQSMQEAVLLAKKHKVLTGAHPSYPDRTGFGRKPMSISNETLVESLDQQISDLVEVIKDHGLFLHHIKFHGALYNLAARDREIAVILTDWMSENHKGCYLYVPFGSKISEAATKKGIKVKYEVFADRNYRPDLCLVDRQEANAILDDENLVWDHVFRMIDQKKVTCISLEEVPILADTVCVHGDNPKAIAIARLIRNRLIDNGYRIQ